MRISLNLKKLLSTTFIVAVMIPSANAQLLKRLQKSAERTVEKKLERKTEKETGKIMDSILDPSQKSPSQKTPSNTPPTSTEGNDSNQSSAPENKNVPRGLEVYSKFDFVPGDKLMFFDDFSNDFVGDFPSKWNTNGTGEIVTMDGSPNKWFEIKSGSISYIPDVPKLPEEYTIEFDFLTAGLDSKTSSGAYIHITVGDKNNFDRNTNEVDVELPLCQFISRGVGVSNLVDGKREMNSTINADIRKTVLQQAHVSIAVNSQRYRFWLNETKYLDIPRIVPVGKISTLRFRVSGLKDGKDRLFLSNLKVAEGGQDLRRTLISEGKISTNGILFDSGSANIKPHSLGIVLQISQVLMQDESIRLNIVGHTDADGNSDNNLKLSKNRAESVKNALVNLYNISADRLETDGKGSEVPVAENSTADGKAQNRRVEFIKI